MTHKEASMAYNRDPETPLNVPKVAKKEAIRYLVPTLMGLIAFAVFVAARSWADDRYTKKTDSEASIASAQKSLGEEQSKREALEVVQQDINRKLDIIIYVLQHNGQIDARDMKGKLSQP